MVDSTILFQERRGATMVEDSKKPQADKSQSAEILQFKQTDWEPPKPAEEEEPKRRRFEDLPPAAQRALKEAEERRKQRDVVKESEKLPTEVGGRGGLDPTRYDDWEIDGRVIDF
jgi:hypothetical protein